MAEGLYKTFADVASLHPESVALKTSDGGVYSYRELAQEVDRLYLSLSDSGLARGDRIAIIQSNGPAFVISAFAIWKLGAIVVPLNPKFQEEELIRYFTDCGIRGALSDIRMEPCLVSVMPRCPTLGVLFLFTSSREWKETGNRLPRTERRPSPASAQVTVSDPALTQYSTGSTGLPKRVTRTHGQVLGESRSVSALLKLHGDDRILGVVPFFHSYGIMNVVVNGILSGASIVIQSEFFPRDVMRALQRESITGFPGVPFMLQMLAEMEGNSDLSQLRYVLSAGAPLPSATAKAFKEKYGLAVSQLYGTTETGVISINCAQGFEFALASAGTNIPGASIEILQEDGSPAPVGAEGRVAIRSLYAGRNYDTEVSSGESYFRDGLFFPGDLGKLDPLGRLTLTGRLRHFINVAGNKVDPTEVENVLKSHPKVSEAAVVGVPNGADGERIKAVLVPSSDLTREEVVQHCKSRIADFKAPSIVEFRSELPKNSMGKILRKYLIEESGAEPANLAKEVNQRYAFSPATGFKRRTGRESAGPAAVIDFPSLPPLLRVLLVTDGTVTKTLEAHLWEPIGIDLLFHAQARAERDYPEIRVRSGDAVLVRRVVLRGQVSRLAYAFAESALPLNESASSLQKELLEGQKGIGELLRARKLETYREIVSINQLKAGEWSKLLEIEESDAVVSRDYVISIAGRPSVLITEVFPMRRFRQAESKAA